MRNSGFTIIEVMIVLAIAALIMLIVFLAVPALQRHVRNLKRKNDIATISSQLINAYSQADAYPDRMRTDVNADSTTNNDTLDLGYDTACSSSPSLVGSVKLQYYNVGGDPNWGQDAGPDSGGSANYGAYISCGPTNTPETPTIIAPGPSSAIGPLQINTESFSIITGENCSLELSRSYFAIYYVLENGSGNGTLACISS